MNKKHESRKEQFALLAWLEAKPGKEEMVLDWLKSALPLAIGEPYTLGWYAFRAGPSTFGIFDSFASTEGRRAHLIGEMAALLMNRASDLLANKPRFELIDLVAVK